MVAKALRANESDRSESLFTPNHVPVTLVKVTVRLVYIYSQETYYARRLIRKRLVDFDNNSHMIWSVEPWKWLESNSSQLL
jgi:hypothetical protein